MKNTMRASWEIRRRNIFSMWMNFAHTLSFTDLHPSLYYVNVKIKITIEKENWRVRGRIW